MSRADLARESDLNLLRLELMLVPPWKWEAVNGPVSTNEVMLSPEVTYASVLVEGAAQKADEDIAQLYFPAMPRPSLWERFKRWWTDA